MASDPYHYPPDLFSLLVDTIPLLQRSKPDTVRFFRACGVDERHLADVQRRVAADRSSITKYDIARTALGRVNEEGDSGLRARREIVRRVVEWEDFSTCWSEEALKAQGLVAKVRQLVSVKDAFVRMQQERDRERDERLRSQREAAAAAQRKREQRQQLYRQLTKLFSMTDPRQRGLELERLLNQIFKLDGLGVRDSFTLNITDGGQIGEQIDGLIELDNQPYLVEVKWWNKPLGVDGVSQHLVRVYSRADVHGLIISASGFAATSIDQCRTVLAQKTIVLAELGEIVYLLEREGDLAEWLRVKTRVAMVDRRPLYRPNVDGVA
ncbi:restriction endonuclease [Saccharothrix syringae]|uniref:Restriction endonuclease n=1 Tax=Saccharothrix syringae TaxID=103733 RepID=A0A5Q0H3Z8_SACSY|nr:restriction endonuclease [Saccharothrix syringae]QFZ20530.1 restriction endonuclease [Saccharothrix syringae]